MVTNCYELYVFGGEGMSEHKIIGMIKDSGAFATYTARFGEYKYAIRTN